jgi:ech hydrogenase subunit D
MSPEINPSPEPIELIAVDALLSKVAARQKEGCRLVQICATRLGDQMELTYSFALGLRLTNLRLQLPASDARVPSVSSTYWCAFLYENEMHDLFNIHIEGMAIDFQGHLYTTAVKYPFGSTKPPQVQSSLSA